MVDFSEDTSTVSLLLVPVPFHIKIHVDLLVQKKDKAISSATA